MFREVPDSNFYRPEPNRDVPDIRLRLAGYLAIFSNPVPAPVAAKMVPGTGYLSRIVLGPFWQLVELSSPSKWAPYFKHVHLNCFTYISCRPMQCVSTQS